MIEPAYLLACIHDSLAAITNPRFFDTERGLQGELLAQLTARVALPDQAILEQEYQKSANLHRLTTRPDIIIHEPYDPERHLNRTEGNVAVVALKLRATANDAIDDFKKLADMIRVLQYPLGIFINIASATTYGHLVPANLRWRVVSFAVALHDGKAQVIGEPPRR
jgi:hypothetical protein